MRVALAIASMILLAGCVTPGLAPHALAPDLLELPEGATVETIPNGLKLIFDAIDLPFARNVTIPEGTTLVRATGLVADGVGVSITMRDAETQRRRCNFAPLDAWNAPLVGAGVCSGVTLVDELPATWEVRAFSRALEGRVEIELLQVPLDGILAELDVSQISLKTHELEETTSQMLPSFDGTPLYVEVTLPRGAGPWPTIIWSSPYDHDDRLAGTPSAWNYFVHDWAKRGYAVVAADVRGYADSEGCVEVWGPNEQKDQVFLVDWVAKQPWSDGNVGFYGQSYVATTPLEAAVGAPEALKAIIAVAPVSDAYNDWHFGGVPNGENLLSPVGYQQTGAGLPFPPAGSTAPEDYERFGRGLAYFSQRADNGFCDATLPLRPNDPRAIYDAFYEERNFSARAADVKAAVLYTQGFEDSNVKSALIPDLFNAIQAPKLGLFGHWVHQHPTRADNEALMLLWLDQFVKGKPVGFERVTGARVVTNDGRERVADAWPVPAGSAFTLHLDPAGGALAPSKASGSATILLDPALGGLGLPLAALPLVKTILTMESAPLATSVPFSGQGQVHLDATLQHAHNGYVAAYLHEVTEDGSKLVTWGMFNLAHRNGHDAYAPVAPGERLHVAIPLLPTEWTFAEGSTLRLELRGARALDWAATAPMEPGALDVYAEGSLLELPTMEPGVPLPLTAMR